MDSIKSIDSSYEDKCVIGTGTLVGSEVMAI